MGRRPFRAGWGWTGLTAYVLTYDSWATKTNRDTMTDVFRKASHHPMRRWPVVLTVGVVVSHLFGWIPTRLDPIHQLAEGMKRLDLSATGLFNVIVPREALSVGEANPWSVLA